MHLVIHHSCCAKQSWLSEEALHLHKLLENSSRSLKWWLTKDYKCEAWYWNANNAGDVTLGKVGIRFGLADSKSRAQRLISLLYFLFWHKLCWFNAYRWMATKIYLLFGYYVGLWTPYLKIVNATRLECEYFGLLKTEASVQYRKS